MSRLRFVPIVVGALAFHAAAAQAQQAPSSYAPVTQSRAQLTWSAIR